MKNKRNRGITLIALVVTIIILLILAGVAINIAVGNKGISKKAREAAEETERAQIQEELEMKLAELQMDMLEVGKVTTPADIKNYFSKIDGMDLAVDSLEGMVEGEYKNFEFIVENDEITVSKKLSSSEKPIGEAINLAEVQAIEFADEVEIQVSGQMEGGTIEKIEALDGAILKEDDERNSDAIKIFTVNDNGTYHFRITGSSGRRCTVACIVNNAVPTRDDLLSGIAGLKDSGYKIMKVNGQTSDGTEVAERYTLDVISCNGDLTLGATAVSTDSEIASKAELALSGSTWLVGKSEDINNNMAVLRVEGNLTIESGYIVTSVGATKGLVIYCTGELINNGTITMNGRGSSAAGQDVFLFKNSDNTYEYIPKAGGAGGRATRCWRKRTQWLLWT